MIRTLTSMGKIVRKTYGDKINMGCPQPIVKIISVHAKHVVTDKCIPVSKFAPWNDLRRDKRRNPNNYIIFATAKLQDNTITKPFEYKLSSYARKEPFLAVKPRHINIEFAKAACAAARSSGDDPAVIIMDAIAGNTARACKDEGIPGKSIFCPNPYERLGELSEEYNASAPDPAQWDNAFLGIYIRDRDEDCKVSGIFYDACCTYSGGETIPCEDFKFIFSSGCMQDRCVLFGTFSRRGGGSDNDTISNDLKALGKQYGYKILNLLFENYTGDGNSAMLRIRCTVSKDVEVYEKDANDEFIINKSNGKRRLKRGRKKKDIEVDDRSEKPAKKARIHIEGHAKSCDHCAQKDREIDVLNELVKTLRDDREALLRTIRVVKVITPASRRPRPPVRVDSESDFEV